MAVKIFGICACLLLCVVPAAACFGRCIVDGPSSPAAHADWLENLKADRTKTLSDINYTGGVFDQIKWTQSAWIQPQMHPYDRFFYDPVTHSYTVQKYLQDLKDRYGGVDAILMWPTYTNIGVDDRNQFDYFRSMPGGLEGVKNVTDELKASGVRVLWPYNPWDTATRREPLDDGHTFAKLLKQTHGDGLNGDTMQSVPESFWKDSEVDHDPLALEPEGGGNDKAMNWETMGWGYWNPMGSYSHIPSVDRFKFLTGGKFMTNVCDRWSKSKTDQLQLAWFNGDGYESWENVWGVWNGITPYDGEAIRRVATMLRYLGKEGFLHSPQWVPHTQDVWQQDVFASKWPLDEKESSVWTIVNRGEANLIVGLHVQGGSRYYYDCYHGLELKVGAGPSASPTAATVSGSSPNVTFSVEAKGYGCVIETARPAEGSLIKFLATMTNLTQQPLRSYSAEWKYEFQQMVEIPKTKPAETAPDGMVLIPKGTFTFENTGVMIEGDDAHGVDVQYSWEDHPQKAHSHALELGPFYIDKYPVTNEKYSAYLKATGFRPADPYRWLQNWWNSSGLTYSSDMPVTYVSLAEARAYCSWAGARLPHSYEWQYAAQGTDGRKYPWGNENDQSRYPVEKGGHTFEGSESVTAHVPHGDSPFGVSDLVGNVWQYTDEFQDAHTRAVILMGGSNYRPNDMPVGWDYWYFPQAKALNTHAKYFLMDDRYERAGTIGFRCVKDAVEKPVVMI